MSAKLLVHWTSAGGFFAPEHLRRDGPETAEFIRLTGVNPCQATAYNPPIALHAYRLYPHAHLWAAGGYVK